MCGITGIITKLDPLEFRTRVKLMTNSLRNRGPDGEGYFASEANGVYLGHRRLSIIDLSDKASQPLYNEDASLVLVFNGEIYNYVELREELLKAGHRFSSATDSEVLLHGWEEWRLGLLDRINGMFAFAIYDKANNEMLLARDNIGIKPLYYLKNKELFAFASESRAFYALSDKYWRPRMDNKVVEKMLLFQYVIDNSDTIYPDVKKLPAGHYLYYKNNGFEIKPYWKLEAEPRIAALGFDEALKECEQLFSRSVRWQLRSDVPVGILLSGGLDSSLVAAFAKKNSEEIHTYTAAFEHKLDERAYAKICAQFLKTRHTEFQIDPLSINNRIEELIKYYDDLSSFDGAVFTIYLMAEKIKQYGVKVLLVGEGSDEIFGGYSWFGLSQFPFSWMPSLARDSLYHYAVSRQFSGAANRKHTTYMHNIIASFGEKDIFRQVSKFEITHQLPNHFLMKVDHGTMAHSLEARVPYLDKDLVRFAFSLPARFKLKGRIFSFTKNNEKLIMREIAKKHLPPQIYKRKKRGFSIPIELVLKSNADKVRDYIYANSSIARSYFTPLQLDKLLNFKNRLYSPVHKQKEFIVWRLFMLDVWKRNVLHKEDRGAI